MPLLALLLIAAPVEARVFLDLRGGAADTGHAGTLWDGGLSAGWDMGHGLAFLPKPEYYGNTENGGGPAETARALGLLLLGLQYARPIGHIPLSWTVSTVLGASYYYEQGPRWTGAFIDPSAWKPGAMSAPHSL